MSYFFCELCPGLDKHTFDCPTQNGKIRDWRAVVRTDHVITPTARGVRQAAVEQVNAAGIFKPVDGKVDLANNGDVDVAGERKGEWTQSLSGRKIYVGDPRPSDFDIGDVANGLAKAGRYGDQIPVEIHYSVAEHSCLMADYAEQELGWSPVACLATLFHDAPEFILKDQHRALKSEIKVCYSPLEKKWHGVLAPKYGYAEAYNHLKDKIKELDVRIVYHEKRAVQRSQLEWAFDKYPPLEGIQIQLWQPVQAKHEWLRRYHKWTRMAGLDEEEYRF